MKNNDYNTYIEKVRSADWDSRIEIMTYSDMLEYLDEVSEANGEFLTFSDFGVYEDSSAVYIRAWNGTDESRIFSTAGYKHASGAFDSAVEFAYRQ